MEPKETRYKVVREINHNGDVLEEGEVLTESVAKMRLQTSFGDMLAGEHLVPTSEERGLRRSKKGEKE